MASFAELKKTADAHFETARAANEVTETTPTALSDAVIEFAATLTTEQPIMVPVVSDRFGLYGWCSDGVSEKVKVDGGSIVFGWTIWEVPKLLLTAEFHAVWSPADGSLVDITPKPNAERQIVFVPDGGYPQDFDFDLRPSNRRMRLYRPPVPDIQSLSGHMKPAQLVYEQARAKRAGIELHEWLLSKRPRDPLVTALDEFIDLCGAHEAKQDSFEGNYFVPDAEYLSLSNRRAMAQRNVKRLSSKVLAAANEPD